MTKRKKGAWASEHLGEWASSPHRPYRRRSWRSTQGAQGGAAQASIVEDPGVRPGAHPPSKILGRAPGRKRRGGQLGNHNALKHGYYSSIFKATERRLLDQLPLTDLSAEIELIRVTNKRFLQALSASRNDLDFETQLTALRAVNLSAHSIATLLRAHVLTVALNRDAAEALPDLGDFPPEQDAAKQP